MKLVTGGWCLFGDFNDIRTAEDRLNFEFNTRDADNFNDFIRKNELVEIPRGVAAVSLDRMLSDHCPILLKDMDMDFGPKPFRAYDVWLKENDIDNVFISAWHNPVRSYKADCMIRDKFKNAKQGLKEWSKLKVDGNNHAIEKCKREAMKWELEAENRVLASSEMDLWSKARKEWTEKENEKVNPVKIKEEIFRFYKDIFSSKSGSRPRFENDHVPRLSEEDSGSLEARLQKRRFGRQCVDVKGEFSKGCNASFVTLIPKVDDPLGLGDYWPISLIGSYYKIISKLLSERIKKVIGNVIGEVQNAFIHGRYILDGVLIVNETMEFMKKKKQKGIDFKLDFEKAYDSIEWGFLMAIKKKMGFGNKWCKWVDSCLRSTSISILVNGSPTREFYMERGVRQGDPLSPFLFILATEGLNALVKEAVHQNIFKGIVWERTG
ncbi:transposon TX1 uncharacterized [Tanacetum coccineum]